jgi:hypothetical protein
VIPKIFAKHKYSRNFQKKTRRHYFVFKFIDNFITDRVINDYRVVRNRVYKLTSVVLIQYPKCFLGKSEVILFNPEIKKLKKISINQTLIPLLKESIALFSCSSVYSSCFWSQQALQIASKTSGFENLLTVLKT